MPRKAQQRLVKAAVPGHAQAATHLAQGQPGLAARLLLPELEDRAAAGDETCGLAAALLRQWPADLPRPDGIPPPPDPLSVALDRMLAVIERQETQIRALHALIEDVL